MDRRYLIATLALIATFALCSHEMRGGRLVVLAGQRLGNILGHCGEGSSAPARIVSEMRARLRSGPREEAQMLAEMNLPMMRVEAKSAALAASQQLQEAKCARETALREAAVARREAQRARQEARQMRHEVVMQAPENSALPIVLKLNDLPQIQQRIHIETNGLQRTFEVSSIALSSDQIDRIDNAVAVATANLSHVDLAPTLAGNGATPLKCRRSTSSWSRQVEIHYGDAMRRAVQSIHNSLNVTNVHQGSGSSL